MPKPNLDLMADLSVKASRDAHEAIMRTAQLAESNFESAGIVMAAHGLLNGMYQGWVEGLTEAGALPPEVASAMETFTKTILDEERKRVADLVREEEG